MRNLPALDEWLSGEDEVYVVVDEAHHAPARSYRRILEYVQAHAANVKLLGLTATPFRTSPQEQGLLGQIFTDDVIYKTDLVTLIKRGILSNPIYESIDTEVDLSDKLGMNAVKSIERLDIIPEGIAQEIAENRKRNRAIVDRYLKDPGRYGQTLVFALNRIHAFTLKALFEEMGKDQGIKAGVIVSGTRAEFTGIDISSAENERQIEAYRNGDLQVLINVNILTEGVDLPKTQTVFLTRPTMSTVLMTQMIGRALRAEKAGGTKDAYIVSFIDEWSNQIAWVNPETVISTEENEFPESEYESTKREMRLVSIEKIEEFARIVNETVDTSRLEAIDFLERVPIGMYVFTFIDENSLEHNHQILVYNNSEASYQALIDSLPEMFAEFGIDDEEIPAETLEYLVKQCESAYFYEDMLPPYNSRDIEYLLKYFAQKESPPLFVPFAEADRQKVDVARIAEHIVSADMRESEAFEYVNALWADESNLLRVYFGHWQFFRRQLDIERDKLHRGIPEPEPSANVTPDLRALEDGPLYEWRHVAPKQYDQLRDQVFTSASEGGVYRCEACGKPSSHRGIFQIDHIHPMSKGGKTALENLQLLCRTCNQAKGDRV